MGAGKGGDGGAEEAAAAAEPVVLMMDLHCDGCAQKVKKIIKRVPGVESIMADALTNRVVVAGMADAAALKARLEAKTKKAVEIISAGGVPKKAAPAAEPKDAGAGSGEKKADKDAPPKEEKEKEKENKQPPEEKKPTEETVLLKIRLHCDGCADRIRRRIYKFKGVKDVMLDSNAKDEVKVRGTMDVAGLLSYLKEKLNRDVEAVAAPAKKDGGEAKEDKKDKGGDGDSKHKGGAAAAASGSGDDTKGKGIEVAPAGPPTAAAAAFMAAPAGPSTYHVAPPQGYVAYQQAPPPPAASYYPPPYAYPYYGNADGMGHANPSAATYYPQPYQQPDGSQPQQQQGYQPYPYRFDMAPAPQLFSDENPNACSVM
ncbi:unnamed protein product [Urochloa decumbens]|uniref:HMA domain-containing protein n=1 Tax=Urochloa decumbens TaxID=240449 RepID=A0ABC8WN45_9POAL